MVRPGTLRAACTPRRLGGCRADDDGDGMDVKPDGTSRPGGAGWTEQEDVAADDRAGRRLVAGRRMTANVTLLRRVTKGCAPSAAAVLRRRHCRSSRVARASGRNSAHGLQPAAQDGQDASRLRHGHRRHRQVCVLGSAFSADVDHADDEVGTAIQPYQAAKPYLCPGASRTSPGHGPRVAVPTNQPDDRRHWHHGCWEHRHRRRPGRAEPAIARTPRSSTEPGRTAATSKRMASARTGPS